MCNASTDCAGARSASWRLALLAVGLPLLVSAGPLRADFITFTSSAEPPVVFFDGVIFGDGQQHPVGISLAGAPSGPFGSNTTIDLTPEIPTNRSVNTVQFDWQGHPGNASPIVQETHTLEFTLTVGSTSVAIAQDFRLQNISNNQWLFTRLAAETETLDLGNGRTLDITPTTGLTQLPTGFGGLQFQASLVLHAPTAVAEPGTLVLTAAGVGVIAAWRELKRRRRKGASIPGHGADHAP